MNFIRLSFGTTPVPPVALTQAPLAYLCDSVDEDRLLDYEIERYSKDMAEAAKCLATASRKKAKRKRDDDVAQRLKKTVEITAAAAYQLPPEFLRDEPPWKWRRGATCRGTTKAGHPCNAIANKESGYCSNHLAPYPK